MNPVVIIPARWASSRFPGKPLADLGGQTVLSSTWNAARKTGWPVIIATDDTRIFEEAERIGATVKMTGECGNGTERCAEVLQTLQGYDVVVNWQGDSPMVPADWAQALVEVMTYEPDCAVATPVQRCSAGQLALMRQDQIIGRAGATCAVLDGDWRALYFSKAVVPFRGPHWLHVGLYAYRTGALRAYGRRAGILEASEGLEQLRFLERGISVRAVPVDGDPIWEVNHPDDISIVRSKMELRHAAA